MTQPPSHTIAQQTEKFTKRDWLALLAAMIVLVLFRLHAFDLPLERDEGNYAYIGAQLLAGDRLYVDVWDHQPPGVFALFSATIALFGDHPWVFRSLACAFSLASLALVFLILRRIAQPWLAMSGAFLFALVSSDPGTAGEGCNREILMNTLILAAWFLNINNCPHLKNRCLLISGVLLGLASTIKTIAVLHWIGLVIGISIVQWRDSTPGRRPRSVIYSLALLGISPAIIWSTLFLYFGTTDRLALFSEAVFGFNLDYAGSTQNFFNRFITFFIPKPYVHIFDSMLPLWLGTAIGLLIIAIRIFQRSSHCLWFVSLMLISSYLAICLPGRFWPHYYYLIVPPCVMAFTYGISMLPKRFSSIAASTMIVAVAFFQYEHYLSRSPLGITFDRYTARDFWARAIGEKIAKVSQPEDSIYVYGDDASVYFYAKRRCASRYTMITALRSSFPDHQRRRRKMLEDLQHDPPRIIIVVLGEEPFPKWKEYLQSRYDAVGWDFHDVRESEPVVMVLADRTRPMESIKAMDWNWHRREAE